MGGGGGGVLDFIGLVIRKEHMHATSGLIYHYVQTFSQTYREQVITRPLPSVDGG